MVRVTRDDERLRMMADLLEQLPAAVAYLAGPDHTFEFANPAYLRLVGRTEVVGRTVAEVLPEVADQGYFELLDQVLATGRPAEGREAELRVRRETDQLTRVFVDFLYEPVHDDDRVVGVLVHAVDVTDHVLDRRRAETLATEVHKAEERYRRLFETMLHGVVYHGPDGRIVAANPMAGEKLGVDPDDLIGLDPQDDGDAVREDGSPFPGDEHPAMVALRTGKIVADVVMGVTHGRTRERRWLSVTAVPDVTDAQGRVQRVYAMFRDITDQKRAEETIRESDDLLGRLRDANVLGILLVDEERVRDANDAFLQMVGYDRDDLVAGRVDWRAMTPPEWQPQADAAVAQLRATGVCKPFEKEYLHVDGRRVPVLVGAAVVRRDPMRWVTFVADLSERQRAEEERVRLLASAQAAMTEAENAGERLSLLLRAGALVTATRDRDDLLRHATRLVVPVVADFAVVFLPDEQGRLVAAVTEHRDPEGSAVLARLREHPISPVSDEGLGAAFATGKSQRTLDVAGRLRAAPGVDPEMLDLADKLRTDSFIAVPLVQDSSRLGVLGLGRTRDRVPFTDQDVAVADELGRRLTVGLTHAETSAREHTVAEMLQRSVLPDVLPSIPGVDLAVVYLPATEGVEVGGDWYDAFPLGEGRIGLALGDVVGHNLASASAMNQVRNALRAYAVDTPDPALVLERTNAALARLMPDAMATVFYGVLDADTGELTYANAGHPPPLLSGPLGPSYLTGAAGLMLGVSDRAEYTASSEHLEAGCAVLLYSDGLVEDRKRSLDQGLDALAGAFPGGGQVTATEMCATAQATMVEGQVRADDVCLLAVQLVK